MADEFKIGEYGARLDGLEESVKEIRNDVKTLLGQMAEARGGWKGMMALAGFASAFGATITWVAQHFWTK